MDVNGEVKFFKGVGWVGVGGGGRGDGGGPIRGWSGGGEG